MPVVYRSCSAVYKACRPHAILVLLKLRAETFSHLSSSLRRKERPLAFDTFKYGFKAVVVAAR